ncbi:hypothetical protein B7494_g265 [Chlorociboria aeruginascens]|nr:hypothetical protein B7494_g265 [Chlorociboria aeruginascens]
MDQNKKIDESRNWMEEGDILQAGRRVGSQVLYTMNYTLYAIRYTLYAIHYIQRSLRPGWALPGPREGYGAPGAPGTPTNPPTSGPLEASPAASPLFAPASALHHTTTPPHRTTPHRTVTRTPTNDWPPPFLPV